MNSAPVDILADAMGRIFTVLVITARPVFLALSRRLLFFLMWSFSALVLRGWFRRIRLPGIFLCLTLLLYLLRFYPNLLFLWSNLMNSEFVVA